MTNLNQLREKPVVMATGENCAIPLSWLGSDIPQQPESEKEVELEVIETEEKPKRIKLDRQKIAEAMAHSHYIFDMLNN